MQTVIQQYCYNCFQPHDHSTGPCPSCGFDLAANAEKYPLALPAGSVLNGRYIVGRVLGQGGFGITYLALDTQLNARVAIKEFLPSEIATRTYENTVSVVSGDKRDDFAYGAERFQEEARTLAKFIGHPNIAGVSSYFDENDTSYFVMDYIEGVSFKSYIANAGGRVSVDDALNVMIPVLRALSAVHAEGFIHRDVTPDNIYISKDGNVKLLDFGSARYSIGDKSKSLDVVLKVGYAPKEQYIRRGRQGPYTDVYSCAASLYAAITGYLPPESLERLDQDTLQPISALGIDIPEYLDKAILKGLAVQPEDRFQSAAEFLDAIESQTVVEVPAGPGQPAAQEDLLATLKKKPKALVGIAAAVLAVVIGLTAFGGGSGGGGGGGEDKRPLIKSEVPSITIQGEEYSTDLRKLDLSDRGLTDEDIQDLKYMVNLSNLQLRGNDLTDISPLAGLTQLECINLMENPNLTDLSPLAGLTNMRQFNYYGTPVEDLSFMAGWTKMEYVQLDDIGDNDLSFLSGMPNVKHLYLQGTNNVIKDLSFLSGMTELTELHLQGDLQLTDISPVAGLTNLTTLSISSNGGTSSCLIADLSPVAGLTSLKELRLDVGDVENLDALAGLTELTTLSIYNDGSSDAVMLRDISGLKDLTKLKDIQLQVAPDTEDFSPLAGLTELTRLQLYGNFYCSDISFLSGLTELRELYFSGNYDSVVRSLKPIQDLTKLQTLNLTCSGLESLEGLEHLTELTELRLNGGDAAYADTAPLNSLTKLNSLDLPDRNYENKTPLDLSGLAGLTSLQSLNISSYVQDLSPLAGLSKLKELRLYDQTYYENKTPLDLSPLGNLTGVTDLQLNTNRSSDLTAIGKMTGLRTANLYIGSYQNKVKDLSPLRNLTNLTSLRINNTVDNIDTSPVAHVTNVTIQ